MILMNSIARLVLSSLYLLLLGTIFYFGHAYFMVFLQSMWSEYIDSKIILMTFITLELY